MAQSRAELSTDGSHFHYRAVAADGKLRTGVITAESSKTVARELIRQGLTPVYVGSEEKKSARAQAAVVRQRPPARRSLFHPGTLDAAQLRRAARSRALDYQRTHHAAAVPHHRARYSALHQRAASRWPIRSRCIPRTSPICSSTWCGPAKRRAASGRSSSGFRNSNARATNCAATSFRR